MTRLTAILALLCALPAAHAGVVRGSSPDGDSRDKRALVLSPYKFEFQAADEGEPIAGILEKTAGYAGRVRYQENDGPVPYFREDERSPDVVGSAQFGIWDAYDVIHVSTHGIFQDFGPPYASQVFLQLPVWAGHDEIRDMVPPDAAVLSDEDLEGRAFAMNDGTLFMPSTESWIEYIPGARRPERKEYDYWALCLSTDFFAKRYRGGFDNKIITFGACETMYVPALPDELSRGDANSVLGWTKAVDAGHCRQWFSAFYQRLADSGLPAGVVFKSLEAWHDASADDAERDATYGRLGPAQPALAGGDLRVREVVRLLSAEQDTGNVADPKPMADGDVLAIVGTPGDGRADRIRVWLEVDGIEAWDGARPAEGDQERGFTVNAWLDDRKVDSISLADAVADDDAAKPADLRHEMPTLDAAGAETGPTLVSYGWRFPWTFDVGRDLRREEKPTLKITVDLPEGGYSVHEVASDLRRYGLIMGGGVQVGIGPGKATPEDIGPGSGEGTFVGGGRLKELLGNIEGVDPEILEMLLGGLGENIPNTVEQREGAPPRLPDVPGALPRISYLPRSDAPARVLRCTMPGERIHDWFNGRTETLTVTGDHQYAWPFADNGLPVTGKGSATATLSASGAGDEARFRVGLLANPQLVRGQIRDTDGEGQVEVIATTIADSTFSANPVFIVPAADAQTLELTLEANGSMDAPGGLQQAGCAVSLGGNWRFYDGDQPLDSSGRIDGISFQMPDAASAAETFELNLPAPPDGHGDAQVHISIEITAQLLAYPLMPIGPTQLWFIENVEQKLPLDAGFHLATADLSGRVRLEALEE